MFRWKEVKDPYFSLRENLYKNIEPNIELIGATVINENDISSFEDLKEGFIERGPGFVARMSHLSEASPEGDIRLNKSLIKMKPVPHKGPFEFTQFVFKITGISKSCLTQFDRHRIGTGFVQMSGRFMDRNKTGFIYNTYDYLDENKAKELLEIDSEHNKKCMELYNEHREKGATKQDARKLLPVSFASGTYVYMNTIALRNLFELRLDSHAEWEIRRMTKIMWDKCYKIAPSHFEDMAQGFEKKD